MIFNLILVGCLVLILFLMKFQIKYITSYKNGYILSTSIPYDLIDDERVSEITEELKRESSLIFKIFLPIALLVFFAETELIKMLLFVFGIIIYAILINIFIYRAMKELREYKKLKRVHSSVKYADLKANVEIKKNMPSKFMHLLPMILLLPGLFFLDFDIKTSTMMLITGALINLSLIYFAMAIEKSPNIIYSEDTEENVRLNIKNKGKFSKTILIFTSFLSVLTLLATIISYKNPYAYWPFIIYVIAITFGMLAIVISQYKISKGDVNLNVDEVDYYDIFGYKNKDDPRIFVPSKMSPGNMDLNRGRPVGKAIFYGSLIIGVVLLASLPYFLSPSNYNYNVGRDKISISAKMYNDEIKYKDIKEIQLLDEFPQGNVVRTNGTSLESQSYGSFSVKGIGNVRLYYYNNSKKVIFIKADKNYIFNEKTDKDTEKLYKEIKNEIK
ncbi:PH domain-containing protein [Lagierella sp. ICN-221743]